MVSLKITTNHLKTIVFTMLYFFTSSISLFAFDSFYSIGSGLSYTNGPFVKASTEGIFPDQIDVSLVQIPLQLYAFWGSRESGGLILGYEGFVYKIISNTSYPNIIVPIAATNKILIGYQLCHSMSQYLLLRYGIEFSGYLQRGSISKIEDTKENNCEIYQISLNIGINGEIDWFPFDTGRGIIDGFFMFGNGYLNYSVSNFSNINIGFAVGFGSTI